jgi:SPP1 family predicted phage head-tail adaptor
MNLDGKVTNPGELDKMVTYYRRTVITKTGGFKVKNLVKIDDAWTKCVDVHGSEAWAANTINAVRAMIMTRRYRADLDETCVAKLDGDYYEIISMGDIRLRHEYIELKVKFVRPG